MPRADRRAEHAQADRRAEHVQGDRRAEHAQGDRRAERSFTGRSEVDRHWSHLPLGGRSPGLAQPRLA